MMFLDGPMTFHCLSTTCLPPSTYGLWLLPYLGILTDTVVSMGMISSVLHIESEAGLPGHKIVQWSLHSVFHLTVPIHILINNTVSLFSLLLLLDFVLCYNLFGCCSIVCKEKQSPMELMRFSNFQQSSYLGPTKCRFYRYELPWLVTSRYFGADHFNECEIQYFTVV